MAKMVSCPNVAVLRSLLLGELSGDEAETLGEHLSACPKCLQAVGEMKTEDDLIRAARGKPEHLPEGIEHRLEDLIRRAQALPVIGADPASITTDLSDPPIITQPGAPIAADRSSESPQEIHDFLEPAQQPGEIGRLGPYRVLRVLGVGGMGVVFQASDDSLCRVVALKVMKPGLADSDQFHHRFQREARAMAALKHDHVVTVYQVGEAVVRGRKVPFAAMEFLEGEPLDARLKKEPRLSPAETVRIGREIALGLAAAHKRGLIHRDIKPGNIWLEGEPGALSSATGGRVKLLDFGLARGLEGDAHLTQSGVMVGTPAYMAPEQARRGRGPARRSFQSGGCAVSAGYGPGAFPGRLHPRRSRFPGPDQADSSQATQPRPPGSTGVADREVAGQGPQRPAGDRPGRGG
jgi:serine/threonine protein kinase